MLNYIFNKYANDNHALNMFLKSVLSTLVFNYIFKKYAKYKHILIVFKNVVHPQFGGLRYYMSEPSEFDVPPCKYLKGKHGV